MRLKLKYVKYRALKGTLTNQKIADFNNLAYKNITKQRLKKKLDDRAIRNVEKMEEVEKKIEEIVSKIDFVELENQESEDNLQTYTCTISTGNINNQVVLLYNYLLSNKFFFNKNR